MAHLPRLLVENVEAEVCGVGRCVEMQADGRLGIRCILDLMQTYIVRDVRDFVFVVRRFFGRLWRSAGFCRDIVRRLA